MFTKIIFRQAPFWIVTSFSFIVVSIVEVHNTTTIKSKAATEDSKHQKTKQATMDNESATKIKSTKKQEQNENIGQIRETENQDYMDNGVAPLSIQGFSQNFPTSDNSNDIIENKFKKRGKAAPRLLPWGGSPMAGGYIPEWWDVYPHCNCSNLRSYNHRDNTYHGSCDPEG